MNDAVRDGAHTGGCLCGAIRYEARGKPKWVAHCHCFTCRRNTGAPVTTFVGFSQDSFTWIGEARERFVSSPGVYRSFCHVCGTPLVYEADRCADEVHVYLSTFDRPQDFPATHHVHYPEKVAWLVLEDGLPRYRLGGTRETPMTADEIAEVNGSRTD